MSDDSTNPFKGLQSYGPDDSSKLFGRERDLILMKDRIFSGRTTLLFAGSGVGKTSFLNAKIIPELEGQYRTFYHSRWAGPSKPLEAVKTTLAEKIAGAETSARLIDCFNEFLYQQPADDGAPEDAGEGVRADQQCLLIFDQFEEIFQYHAYEDYFKRFLDEVCEVVRRDDYRVHLVISMREEYLGELSVFDNLIPDLFNNYYRLRYPNKRDAAQIIEGTCNTVETGVDRGNLKKLISDLSKIEKGVASAAERSTHDDKEVGHVVERNFIIPPYLQIVCHRQWEEQAKLASTNGSNGMVFLDSYRENDAQNMLRDYCQEKLSALSFMEQNIAERSFDFLVTKQGAKMAYEFTSLVEHMRLRFFKSTLKSALNKLSVPETRILRKSHGPDGSVWFELYHDIYGKILDTWRATFRARKHRLAVLFGIGALALLLVLIPITWHWGIRPYYSRKTLLTANLENPEKYGDAVKAYDSLSQTWGYGSRANSWFADAWERRALYAESHNERDEAIISWLKALSLKPDAPHADMWRLKAGNLIGDDYQRVNHRLYHDNRVTSAIFSDNGQLVVTKTDDGRIWAWDAKTGALLGKHDDPQSSVPSEPLPTPSDATASTPKPKETPAERGSKPRTNTMHAGAIHPELGWLVAITLNESLPLRSEYVQKYHRLPDTYRSQPVLLLSDNDELISSGIQIEQKWTEYSYADPDVAMSADGKFVATSGRGETTRVWKIENNKAIPVEGFRANGFVYRVTFSPDGKSLAMVNDQKQLSMWDVATGQMRYPPILFKRNSKLRFNSNSDHFVVSDMSDDYATITLGLRDTQTGKLVGKPQEVTRADIPPESVYLSADNKVLLFSYREEYVWIADPITNEFRKTTRINAVENPISTLGPGGDVALNFRENEVRLHRIAWQTANPMLNAGETIESSVLSEDGARITTLIRKPAEKKESIDRYDSYEVETFRAQVWDANTLAPISNAIDNAVVLSDNGEYAATIEPKQPKRKLPRFRRLVEDGPKETTVRILNARTGSEVMKFQYPSVVLFDRLVSSPSGRFFATYQRKRDSSYEYYRMLYFERVAGAGADQAELASQEAGDVYVWDSKDASRPVVPQVYLASSSQYTCAFSKDERYFALSGTGSAAITLWDLQQAVPVLLTKNLTTAGALAFNEHGQLIAGGSKKVRIWDLATRQPINELDTTNRISAIALSGDGHTALLGDVSGNVSSWRFQTNAAAYSVGEQVRHRDYPNSITLSTNESAGVVSAGNWLHTTNAADHKYTNSYFLGSTWLKQCRRMDDSSSRFKCLFQLSDGKPKVKYLEGGRIEENTPVQGDAQALFEEWKKRLGVDISNLGKIAPKETGSASATTETKK